MTRVSEVNERSTADLEVATEDATVEVIVYCASTIYLGAGRHRSQEGLRHRQGLFLIVVVGIGRTFVYV